MLLQLQQVPAAWQSTQMAMKHQQQPKAMVVRKAVDMAVGIGQLEWHGGPADLTSKGSRHTMPL
ncbi:MAG: hypothetical protein HYX76_15455 [Acidobacteria bacterium]|nr:hypothetical protein [Acidobacteriota bacterium]